MDAKRPEMPLGGGSGRVGRVANGRGCASNEMFQAIRGRRHGKLRLPLASEEGDLSKGFSRHLAHLVQRCFGGFAEEALSFCQIGLRANFRSCDV